MSVGGDDSAKEHVEGVKDILQQIMDQEPTSGGLDINDASGHHALDQKAAAHAMENNSNDVTSDTSADEGHARASLDTVFGDKTNEERRLRPYEPIAKTLEADKENITDLDTVPEHADTVSSSQPSALAPHENMDLNVAPATEDSSQTHCSYEFEPTQEVRKRDSDINATTVVPVALASEAAPSLPQAPVVPQVLPPVEPEAQVVVVASEAYSIEAQPVSVETNSHVAEPAAIAPEVENSVPAVESSTTEPEGARIQRLRSACQQEPHAAAETAEVHTLETPRQNDDTQIAKQLAAVVTGSEVQVENVEVSPAVIEQPVLHVESLVAVDAMKLAKALVEDNSVPDTFQPQTSTIAAETQPVEQLSAVEPEVASSVEVAMPSDTTGVTADFEEAPREADLAVVRSASDVQQKDAASDSLSPEHGDTERPKSPWTPSYSVTTQGPQELSTIEKAVEPEELEVILPPTKESTPEIVVGHVAEVASEPDNAPASHTNAEILHESVTVQAHQGKSTQEEEITSKSSPGAVSKSTLSISCEEAVEERPKSPWTPSYSVTTQGSATSELDELDQLPPRAIEGEQFTNGAVDEPGHSEPVAVEAPIDAILTGNESGPIQPLDVPAIGIAPAVPAAATALQEGEKPALVVSSTSEDDTTSPLTEDTSLPKLDDEGDARPKSPWTPSYSVTSQGSAHEIAEAEDIEQMTSSSIELINQPDVDQTDFTTETPLPSVLDEVVEGDQNGGEDLRDHPLVVPSIDITESQEVPKVPSIHEATDVDQTDDIAAPTQSQSSADEVAPKPPLQLMMAISPHVDEQEDRPKSPWTPSYSVTIQGSATMDSDLDQLEQLPPATGGSVDESTVGSAEMMTDPIQPNQEIEAENQASKPTAGEVASQMTSRLQAALLDEPEVSINAVSEVTTLTSEEQTNPSLAIPETNVVEDRPPSPWTPSYSVTTQGPGVSDGQESGLHEEDVDSPSERANEPDAILSVTTEDTDDVSASSNVPEPPQTPQSELGIFTPGFDTRSEVSAASREPASPTSSRTDLASVSIGHGEEPASPDVLATLVHPVLANEQDDRTPQLTPLATTKDVLDAIAGEGVAQESTPIQAFKSVFEGAGSHDVPEIFPSSSGIIMGESLKTIQEKPSLLRLTSPNEDETSDRPLLSFEMPSSATSRKRLESTASSRFLPGGWFSSSPTVSETSRTRTSLDVASGEFIRSPSTESHSSDESLASEAAHNAADEEAEEKKARWCTIM